MNAVIAKTANEVEMASLDEDAQQSEDAPQNDLESPELESRRSDIR